MVNIEDVTGHNVIKWARVLGQREVVRLLGNLYLVSSIKMPRNQPHWYAGGYMRTYVVDVIREEMNY